MLSNGQRKIMDKNLIKLDDLVDFMERLKKTTEKFEIEGADTEAMDKIVDDVQDLIMNLELSLEDMEDA